MKLTYKKINILCAILAAVAVVVGGAYYKISRDRMDRRPPELTVEQEEITCSINASKEELIKGLTAIDDRDGDITDHIRVSDIRINKDSDRSNEFTIRYVVYDSSSNIATASRTLIYEDYTSPRFSFSKPLQFYATSAVNLYGCIVAEDCIEGDISARMAIDVSDAFRNAEGNGEYEAVLRTSNMLGDEVELPITFDVMEADISRPVILLSEYTAYLEKGSTFNPKEYLEYVIIDNVTYELGEIPEEMDPDQFTPYLYGYFEGGKRLFTDINQISIASNVDTDKPGEYTVTYSFRNPKEGTYGFTKLFVTVEE